jgi:hypothetical protein
MDSHAHPNMIYAALMSTAETIPGKAALLHWLQFAALGEEDSNSRASRLAVNLSVCNEFSSPAASEAVYQGLGEAMEQERDLGDLFDLVFTLPQTKHEPVKTSTQTMIDTSVVNLQSELLAQQQLKSRVPAPPPIINLQTNTGANLFPPQVQGQQHLRQLALPTQTGGTLQQLARAQNTSTALVPQVPNQMAQTQLPGLGQY